jgi:hypothetical protein
VIAGTNGVRNLRFSLSYNPDTGVVLQRNVRLIVNQANKRIVLHDTSSSLLSLILMIGYSGT